MVGLQVEVRVQDECEGGGAGGKWCLVGAKRWSAVN